MQDDKIKPEVKAGNIVKWLKEDLELGHRHSMTIYALLKGAKDEKKQITDSAKDKKGFEW